MLIISLFILMTIKINNNDHYLTMTVLGKVVYFTVNAKPFDVYKHPLQACRLGLYRLLTYAMLLCRYNIMHI